jgi:hypothetical protein
LTRRMEDIKKTGVVACLQAQLFRRPRKGDSLSPGNKVISHLLCDSSPSKMGFLGNKSTMFEMKKKIQDY